MLLASLSLIQSLCLAAFAFVLVLAAWQDVRTLRIADACSLTVVVLYGGWALAGLCAETLPAAEIGLSLAGAAALFCAGALAFAANLMGGADVKLLTASGLFAGPALFIDFLAVTALAGAALAIFMLAATALGVAPAVGDMTGRRRRLPFGPAIAMGGLWVAAMHAVP